MQNFIFIFFSVSVVVFLIYFVYKAMLGANVDSENDYLQITADELLAQVKILYKQKKYSIVESLAKKYLENKHSDIEVRTVLVKALHANGKVHDAIEHAKTILKHHPKNYDMKIFIANCYIETAKPSSAISMLQDVLESDFNNVVAIKTLAKIYLDLNQKSLAIKMYERLEEFLYSNNEKANNKKLLAKLHIYFKEYDAAINEYNGVLELYPADVEARKNLVDVYKLTSDYESLVEVAEEVLSLNSGEENDLWALRTLTDAFWATRDYDKALEYANKLKEHSLADKTEGAEYIARIYMEKGQVNESIDLLSELIVENAHNIKLKKTLAQSYAARNDFALAANMYKMILDEAGVEEITEIHYEMSNLYAAWGEYLFTQGDNEACFKTFATAIQYYSENASIYYLLGVVNQSIKNFNEAISQFKKAIELDCENSRYYYSLAECYSEIDSVYEEKKALHECLKYNPNNTLAQYKLALLYEVQHETATAMDMLRKTIALDDNFLDAKYRLALLLEAQGHRDESIALYEDILFRNPEYENASNNLRMLKA